MIGYVDLPPSPPAIIQSVVMPSTALGSFYEVDGILTAYTSSVEDCGKSDGITASGYKASRGTIAAPKVVPFFTRIEYEGKTYVVHDRGGAIVVDKDWNYHFDVWLPTAAEVKKFGVKKAKIKIYRRLVE